MVDGRRMRMKKEREREREREKEKDIYSVQYSLDRLSYTSIT